jgi:ketosteroid isomerase-like protein
MASTTSETQAVVTGYLQALGGRDIPALLEFFADSVDWDVPGARELAPWLGARRSRAEVQQFFELLFAHTVAVNAQVEALLVDGAVAIVTGTFSTLMKQTGRQYDSTFFIHLTTNRGKIERYRLLEDTWALVQALAQRQCGS